jgi:formate dehydrogenase iron-sulfur subunit
VKALQKSENGPVTYNAERCVGCRYCMMACPFGVPTFQWDENLPLVGKCNLCAPRVARGEPTACAAACPVGAITFGRRGELVAEAHKRIQAEPKRYQPHVFGEKEVGGTSVMYVSDVPFSELGFREGLPTTPLPKDTWRISRLIPPVALAWGGLLTAAYVLVRRERRIEEEGGGEE